MLTDRKTITQVLVDGITRGRAGAQANHSLVKLFQAGFDYRRDEFSVMPEVFRGA